MDKDREFFDFVTQLEGQFPKTDKKLRIKSLWPSDYIVKLPVEPAIPSNFVFKSFPQDIYPGYFAWGPKEVFETDDYLDVNLLTQSILVFNISNNTAQTGPKSFSDDDQIEVDCKKAGIKDVIKKIYMWGKYPVMHVGGTQQGKDIFSAWIGCNYCSNVIFAHLAYPNKEGRPNKEDMQLWKTFLSQTKPLSEKDNLLVQGWDVQPGYTWLDDCCVKVFSIAERRKRDGIMQIVVVCQSDATTFSPSKVLCGTAGGCLLGKEIVKIYAKISKKFKEGGSVEMPIAVINILVKNVDEFSLDKDSLFDDPRIFVCQKALKVEDIVYVSGITNP